MRVPVAPHASQHLVLSVFRILVILLCVSCSVMSDFLQLHVLGSAVHGILKVRILEWVAIYFLIGIGIPRYKDEPGPALRELIL